jgi:8-oxo-dGTP pyrophosphatase MutT (NUDIX family)
MTPPTGPPTVPRIADAAELAATEDLRVARGQVASLAAPSLRGERDRVLAFIDAHADALARSCVPGHLTGSAFVVDPARGRFLLLHHTKLRKWLQPGGHADGDGNLAAVALREASEETGIEGLQVVVPPIDIDVHLVEPPHEPAHHHYDLRFLVLAPDGAQVSANHESTDQRWATVDELDTLGCDDGVRRMANAGLAVLTRLGAPGSRTGR